MSIQICLRPSGSFSEYTRHQQVNLKIALLIMAKQDKALALEVIRLIKFDKAAQYSIMCCQLHPQRVERNDQQLQHLSREVQHREHSARNRLYYQYGHSRGRGGQTGA